MKEDVAAAQFAATFADELAAAGLRHVCLAPGSRSAPLAMAFARHPSIRVHVHIDERSCGFFGLGLAKASSLPVALVCTSGTAAVEFHPAVVEADHSRTPLLVLTADRPPELIGVGANQAIDQAHLYGTSVRWYHDPGVPSSPASAGQAWRRLAVRALDECWGPPPGPVHLNLPFREPLTPPPGEEISALGRAGDGGRSVRPPGPGLPGSPSLARLRVQVASARRPVVIAGEMRDGAALRPGLAAFAEATGAAVLAEPASQLRVTGTPGLTLAYDAVLRTPWAKSRAPDLVLRLGAAPTSKPLNQWLAAQRCPTILVDPDGVWRDPDRLASERVRADPGPLLAALADGVERMDPDWQSEWVDAGQAAARALGESLASGPLFEGQAVTALAHRLPAETDLMIGSSMPIRDVDTFWPAAKPGQRFLGNRGASGIDGLVSTGLGVAAAGRAPAVLLLGDLSLYHDMNGLWALRRYGLPAIIVVLDNNGGGIFSFLPQAEHHDVFERLFGTPLDLDLSQVARLYGLAYCSVTSANELDRALAAGVASDLPSLIRVAFSRADSVRGHRHCWQATAQALAQLTQAG